MKNVKSKSSTEKKNIKLRNTHDETAITFTRPKDACSGLFNLIRGDYIVNTHIYVHTHMYIRIYMYVYMYTCIYKSLCA